MNPRYDGTPEQDGPPDWFDDLHSDDPRSPEHNPPPNDQPEPEPQAKDIGSEYAEATGEADFADPVDILGNAEMAGYPELTPDCVPAVIYNHTMAEGHRMLADPVAIATHCLGATSLVISDMWRIKPKLHDPRFLPQARLWTCVIKPPGARGTDMLKAAYRPVEQIAAEHREQYERERAEWLQSLEKLKGDELKEAKKNEPRQTRVTPRLKLCRSS
jgi:hypothetical protein